MPDLYEINLKQTDTRFFVVADAPPTIVTREFPAIGGAPIKARVLSWYDGYNEQYLDAMTEGATTTPPPADVIDMRTRTDLHKAAMASMFLPEASVRNWRKIGDGITARTIPPFWGVFYEIYMRGRKAPISGRAGEFRYAPSGGAGSKIERYWTGVTFYDRIQADPLPIGTSVLIPTYTSGEDGGTYTNMQTYSFRLQVEDILAIIPRFYES